MEPKYRRSRFDVVADILEVARGGTKKTTIVYSANLNFEVLGRYLADLVARGLIRRNNGEKIIELTEKGQEYLRRYRKLRELY